MPLKLDKIQALLLTDESEGSTSGGFHGLMKSILVGTLGSASEATAVTRCSQEPPGLVGNLGRFPWNYYVFATETMMKTAVFNLTMDMGRVQVRNCNLPPSPPLSCLPPCVARWISRVHRGCSARQRLTFDLPSLSHLLSHLLSRLLSLTFSSPFCLSQGVQGVWDAVKPEGWPDFLPDGIEIWMISPFKCGGRDGRSSQRDGRYGSCELVVRISRRLSPVSRRLLPSLPICDLLCPSFSLAFPFSDIRRELLVRAHHVPLVHDADRVGDLPRLKKNIRCHLHKSKALEQTVHERGDRARAV